MHEVLVNRLGGLSLPRKSVVRLTDHPDMTLGVYRGRKTTIQHFERVLLCRKADRSHKYSLPLKYDRKHEWIPIHIQATVWTQIRLLLNGPVWVYMVSRVFLLK